MSLEWIAAVSAVLLVAATVAAFVAAWRALRRDYATTPAWQPGELAAFTRRSGAHRAVGTYAWQGVAGGDEYRPRHSLDPDEDGCEIPPSIVPALSLMTPSERARELVRQLGQKSWHPWRHLPRLDRIRFVAATVARRNRVPLLLGHMGPARSLP